MLKIIFEIRIKKKALAAVARNSIHSEFFLFD